MSAETASAGESRGSRLGKWVVSGLVLAIAGVALARIEVVPRAGRQCDVDTAAGLDDRRDEQRVAAHELGLEAADQRVVRICERHRAHHG